MSTNPYLQHFKQDFVKPPSMRIGQGTSTAVTEGVVSIGDIYKSDTKEVYVKKGEPFCFIPLISASSITISGKIGNFLASPQLMSGKSDAFETVPLIESGPRKNSHLLIRKYEFVDGEISAQNKFSGMTLAYNREVVFLCYVFNNAKKKWYELPVQLPCASTNLSFARKLSASITRRLIDDSSSAPFNNIYSVLSEPRENKKGHFFSFGEPKFAQAAPEEIVAKAATDFQHAKKLIDESRIEFVGGDSDGEGEFIEERAKKLISQEASDQKDIETEVEAIEPVKKIVKAKKVKKAVVKSPKEKRALLDEVDRQSGVSVVTEQSISLDSPVLEHKVKKEPVKTIAELLSGM